MKRVRSNVQPLKPDLQPKLVLLLNTCNKQTGTNQHSKSKEKIKMTYLCANCYIMDTATKEQKLKQIIRKYISLNAKVHLIAMQQKTGLWNILSHDAIEAETMVSSTLWRKSEWNGLGKSRVGTWFYPSVVDWTEANLNETCRKGWGLSVVKK